MWSVASATYNLMLQMKITNGLPCLKCEWCQIFSDCDLHSKQPCRPQPLNKRAKPKMRFNYSQTAEQTPSTSCGASYPFGTGNFHRASVVNQFEVLQTLQFSRMLTVNADRRPGIPRDALLTVMWLNCHSTVKLLCRTNFLSAWVRHCFSPLSTCNLHCTASRLGGFISTCQPLHSQPG